MNQSCAHVVFVVVVGGGAAVATIAAAAVLVFMIRNKYKHSTLTGMETTD